MIYSLVRRNSRILLLNSALKRSERLSELQKFPALFFLTHVDSEITKITNVGPILNTCTTSTYYDFVSSEDSVVFLGDVYMIGTETTPLPDTSVGLEVLSSYHNYFVDIAMANELVPGLTATMAWQPLPNRLAQKAKANGGDLIDLDDSVDRLLFEFDYSFTSTLSDTQMTKVMETLFSGIRKRVQGFIANRTLPDACLPLFMNDANFQEDY